MLTNTQASTLKVVALADPVADAYIQNGNDTQLAEWFNESTATVAWRSVVSPAMSRAAIIVGATQLDAMTVGKRDSLFYLTSGDLNAADAAVRAALDDLCGSQNTLKNALQAAQKRLASRAEKALSTGLGTTLSPATMSFEGALNINDAADIRNAL